MHVQLMIGPGWDPFIPLTDDDIPMIEMDGVEHVDTAASAANLSRRLLEKFRRVYPREHVEVLPPDPDTGDFCYVDFNEDDFNRFMQLTGVPIEEVANPGQDGPGLVLDAVHSLLYETLEEDGWAIAKN